MWGIAVRPSDYNSGMHETWKSERFPPYVCLEHAPLAGELRCKHSATSLAGQEPSCGRHESRAGPFAAPSRQTAVLPEWT